MTASAPPQRVTLITGTDDLLVSRAIAVVVNAARAADPMAEVNDFAPGQFTSDEAMTLNNPSLFGGWRVVVVRGVQDLPEDVAAALLAYAQRARPGDGARPHGDGPAVGAGERAAQAQGQRGQGGADHQPVEARSSSPSDEARRHGGRITDDAARMLVEAVGSDLGAIAGAVEQLMASTGPRGLINDETVAQHFRGRAETTGFNIADAVLNGELERGLTLLRQSLEVGTPPVFIPSALAGGLREIAKVSAASERRGQSRGRAGQGAADARLEARARPEAGSELAGFGDCATRSSPSPRPMRASRAVPPTRRTRWSGRSSRSSRRARAGH